MYFLFSSMWSSEISPILFQTWHLWTLGKDKVESCQGNLGQIKNLTSFFQFSGKLHLVQSLCFHSHWEPSFKTFLLCLPCLISEWCLSTILWFLYYGHLSTTQLHTLAVGSASSKSTHPERVLTIFTIAEDNWRSQTKVHGLRKQTEEFSWLWRQRKPFLPCLPTGDWVSGKAPTF